jgi:hypothetical protein
MERMVSQDQIVQLVNARVKKILDFAELSLPQDKFPIFRKLTLDEFGRSGLLQELERVMRFKER